jgi:hypothetical protein
MEVSGQLDDPAALPPGKRTPGNHWIGGWMGPRAVLDAVVKRKIPSPRRESDPRTPIVQLVAQCYTVIKTTELTEMKITLTVKSALLLEVRIQKDCGLPYKTMKYFLESNLLTN